MRNHKWQLYGFLRACQQRVGQPDKFRLCSAQWDRWCILHNHSLCSKIFEALGLTKVVFKKMIDLEGLGKKSRVTQNRGHPYILAWSWCPMRPMMYSFPLLPHQIFRTSDTICCQRPLRSLKIVME